MSARGRVKVSEKFNDEESTRLLMDGSYRSLYNLIRPHMVLDGETPAENAGFQVQVPGPLVGTGQET